MIKYTNMVDVLTPDKVGEAELYEFEITIDGLTRAKLTSVRNHGHDEFEGQQVGRFMGLKVSNTLVMTDTEMERRTNDEFIRRAHGRVLIAGLGMGVVLFPLCEKKEVTHITVVEKSRDVLALVIPQLPPYMREDVRFDIADIFEYEPDTQYDCIYFDIWPSVNSDNYPEMKRLFDKYKPHQTAHPDRYMSAWRINDCREQHQEDVFYSAQLKLLRPDMYEQMLEQDKVVEVPNDILESVRILMGGYID